MPKRDGTPKKRYEELLSDFRCRESKVKNRALEEEADADRGRVLFCSPFRRLQNKAQVFSLETNAAVRSRLTHSLEVSSIGRLVALQAIGAFPEAELVALGIWPRRRALITFVETACLLHDIGNPPFGHFGEIAISDWFHVHADGLRPQTIGTDILAEWDKYYRDFQYFDGNPQGFRCVTRLQASRSQDLNGLNLTATTLAATIKYPWTSESVGKSVRGIPRKKAGYFQTEVEVVEQLWNKMNLQMGTRHPLAFLMEAADDIAYCLSDIEDAIEKNLITAREFADAVRSQMPGIIKDTQSDRLEQAELLEIGHSLTAMGAPAPGAAATDEDVIRFTPMVDFRSAVVRYLAHRAGKNFRKHHEDILTGKATEPLLGGKRKVPLLSTLNDYAASVLYSSRVVRQRELTAHAVLFSILDAYFSLMTIDRSRFQAALDGHTKDESGRRITREASLAARIAKKYLAVYTESVRLSDATNANSGLKPVMEKIYRLRLIVDYISGMTDEYALQTHQLIGGFHVNPHRN